MRDDLNLRGSSWTWRKAQTLSLPYNNLGAAAFGERPDGAPHGAIAAVIVEPVAGNMGVVPPAPGFLAGLRDLCTRHGALLIFDEVITGFRLAWGGAQQRYGVTPDLTCLGKIVGCLVGRACSWGTADDWRRGRRRR